MSDDVRDIVFSIIMPAYNEEDVISATVDDLCGFLDQTDFRYELIIVDDASTDTTPDLIAELGRRHHAVVPIRNDGLNGYGYAIRKGLEIYKGDAAVVVTSDGADLPKDVG